jgi:uncharacterized paraquat-inducible protein A
MSIFMACDDYDLLNHVFPLPRRATAYCPRCGSLLLRSKPNSIERSLAQLAKLATIIPGSSLWAFALMIFTTAAQTSVLDTHKVWAAVEASNGPV